MLNALWGSDEAEIFGRLILLHFASAFWDKDWTMRYFFHLSFIKFSLSVSVHVEVSQSLVKLTKSGYLYLDMFISCSHDFCWKIQNCRSSQNSFHIAIKINKTLTTLFSSVQVNEHQFEILNNIDIRRIDDFKNTHSVQRYKYNIQ